MADRIILKHSSLEANLANLSSENLLNGELALVNEAGKECLYCINSSGELEKIHRIFDCGIFEFDPIFKLASQTVAGDMAFYDKSAKSIVLVDHTKFSADLLPSSNYTPIGVVAVPGTHDVYGDGTCGVLSLVDMNYLSPDSGFPYDYEWLEANTGNTELQEQWKGCFLCYGGYNVDVPGITNYMHFPGYGDLTSQSNLGDSAGIITAEYEFGSVFSAIPSDAFSTGGWQCPHDTNSYYSHIVIDVGSDAIASPSPYLTDGSRNPSYYSTTSPSSTDNTFAYFNGKENSQALWDLATGQSDWQTASTITNNSGSTYYPAACCCWRYHTEGTSQGDWFLPSNAEWGYISSRANAINNSISQISTAFTENHYSKINTSADSYPYGFWSSSEMSAQVAYLYYTAYGILDDNGKFNGYYGFAVRALLRV